MVVYVVRTAWLYGEHGRDFVKTVLSRTATGAPMSVVTDQHGQPTWSRDLAVLLARLGHAALSGDAPPGIYHGTASGRTTWFGLAREVLALARRDAGLIHPHHLRRLPPPGVQRPRPPPLERVRHRRAASVAGLPRAGPVERTAPPGRGVASGPRPVDRLDAGDPRGRIGAGRASGTATTSRGDGYRTAGPETKAPLRS
ncbi:sugar nucleotide-binding protein [Streptomyces misionensis]|uniref:sugar nucleotide-binding protein n=1 Tax=Streptomyces misionensis TaxID=67331 RepID=UPI0033A7F56C